VTPKCIQNHPKSKLCTAVLSKLPRDLCAHGQIVGKGQRARLEFCTLPDDFPGQSAVNRYQFHTSSSIGSRSKALTPI
jgi:hypothetical protein